MRDLLVKIGKPYVIENVEGARAKLINPLMLCGTMFGLQSEQGLQLRRHRYFECGDFYSLVSQCFHNDAHVIGVYGGGQNPARQSWYRSKNDTGFDYGIQARRQAMGIDWMIGRELVEAIPPAYTEFIGRHLIQALKGQTL